LLSRKRRAINRWIPSMEEVEVTGIKAQEVIHPQLRF
jgi:hypothetical protein